MEDCIFCKVIAGELPSWKVYEDEHVLAILDLSPVHKGHTVVVLKKHFPYFTSVEPKCLSGVLEATQKVAQAVMAGTNAGGCNISTNNGLAANQTIFHHHWHIIPRFDGDDLPMWPQGTYEEGEKDVMAEKIRNSF